MWDTVIGIETHVQLATSSKIFSTGGTKFGNSPNSQIDYVDVGLPGVLPVLNAKAVELAVKFGIAVGGQIANESIFARKNYFYPDLPKGYQISQFEKPIVVGGSLEIKSFDSSVFNVPLVRAHLEEDAGKSVHDGVENFFPGFSGIDLNRAGMPLLEIVTEPTLTSAQEAVAYGRTLHNLVTWIEICDGNMQEGSFRMDANVSIKPRGAKKLGVRCEIKNLNSFRYLEKAIRYEVARQIDIIESGGMVTQQTRLFDPVKNETREMRSKENSDDYRYFPDPDLPPLIIESDYIEQVGSTLPELPDHARSRLSKKWSLPDDLVMSICSKKQNLIFFEESLKYWFRLTSLKFNFDNPDEILIRRSKILANWLTGELFSILNKENIDICESKISPKKLSEVLIKLEDNTLSKKTAKQLFSLIWNGEKGDINKIIIDKNLNKIEDDSAVEDLIGEVISKNQKMVNEFRSGKEKALNALVGQVMKKSGGRAEAKDVKEKILLLIG
tara:strand:- start:58378 stop:59874 length:1497 start_codon:yes stop_codon:yes gene_type:complete